MEDQKSSSKRKLEFIHNQFYDLVFQISENESTKITGYNKKMYHKMKELSEKQSQVKIETKVSQKDNSLFFNDDCNVYSAEPCNVPFKSNNQIKLSSSSVRQSTKYLIDNILKMTPNCGELVTISATLTVSSYVPVNTRYRDAEIKKACVLENTTGFMFCRLRKSVCEKLQTTNNYQLPHMVLEEYRGELYLALTLNTTAEEIQ